MRAVWIPELDWNQLPHQKDILGFSPNYSDGNTHALSSPNFSTFREAWSSLEAFQKHIFKRLTQSEAIVTDEDELASERGIDYRRLRDFLRAGNWKEADEETLQIMLQATGRKSKGWLDDEAIQNFPCVDLRSIDTLWFTLSNGHFSFSVQNRIWQACGGKPGMHSLEVFHKFGHRVGWCSEEGKPLTYKPPVFDLTAPEGHLPAIRLRRLHDQGGFSLAMLMWRLEGCGI